MKLLIAAFAFSGFAYADVLVGNSFYCGECFLKFDSELNYIERRLSSVSTQTSTRLKWNASLSPLAAVETDAAVFAVAASEQRTSEMYVWDSAPVRLSSCPDPKDVRMVFSFTFMDFIDTANALPVFLLRPHDGAVFAVNTTGSSPSGCQSTFLSYASPHGMVVDVSYAYGCAWYLIVESGWAYVTAPRYNITTNPIYYTSKNSTAYFVVRLNDGSEELLLITKDLSTQPLDGMAQNPKSLVGKVLHINRDGHVDVLAGGLCNPTSVVNSGFEVVFVDKYDETTELNIVSGIELLTGRLNFGWPMVKAKVGHLVFVRAKPFSTNFRAPTMVLSTQRPFKSTVEDASYKIIIGIVGTCLLAVGFRLYRDPQVEPQDTVLVAVIAVLIAFHIPYLVRAPGYDASASLVGVSQSNLWHPPAWLGSFATFSGIGLVGVVVATVAPRRARWVALAVTAGVLSMHTIVLAGGVRRPWTVSWEGWVLGALCIILGSAAILVQPQAPILQYEQL